MTAPGPSRMKIGFLTPHSPYSRYAFSGSSHHAHRALAAHPEVDLVLIGNHRPPRLWHRLRPPPAFAYDPRALTGLDGIIALAATAEIAALPPLPLPVIMVTDATPAFLAETYGPAYVASEATEREAAALARATRVVYSSDYMADRAVREFGPVLTRPPAVAAFGINLDHLPPAPPDKPPLDPLRLLFLGLDWDRKGGDVAVGAAHALAARGIAVRLTCAGMRAEGLRGDPLIEPLGYLDKSRPDHARQLDRALSQAHLLILPTRADCTPMVVAEANAHGTPAVTSDVGGLPTLVHPGDNGALLPAGASAQAYADAITALIADPADYAALSRRSHAAARDRLCWTAWAAQMVDLIRAERSGDQTVGRASARHAGGPQTPG